MKRDIVEKLEFGCPFKQDVELADVLMQEAANVIKALRAFTQEFVGDIESAHGSDLDDMNWPDLQSTYGRAKAFLKKLEA